MSLTVHSSALKHGMDPEDSLYAANWPLWVEPLDGEKPQRALRLGFDMSGRLLELVVLIFDSGDELIIHSMKARPEYMTSCPSDHSMVSAKGESCTIDLSPASCDTTTYTLGSAHKRSNHLRIL